MTKSRNYKNVYLHFTSKDFRYISVEAIDDNGNEFSYTFNGDTHEEYLQEAKDMCERFEKFCKDTCGLYDSRYCDVWTIGDFSPVPCGLEYEALFDKSTIYTEDYKHNFEIYERYTKYNLDHIIGQCDWACGEYLSSQYGIKISHIKNPKTYERFLGKYLIEKNAAGVKSVVSAYREQIDKKKFTAGELNNIKAYMLDNMDLIFDRNPFATREKSVTYFALSEAATRLYKHDNATFQEIIHKLMHELNLRHYTVDTAIYHFISTFCEDYYESRNKSFEGILSEHKFLPKFCSLEDRIKLREMIYRHEYRNEGSANDGFWLRNLPDEYIINEIIATYKVDKIPLGAIYILPNGTILHIKDGHRFICEYLYEKGIEKNYKLGQPSKVLQKFGWIRANTKLWYIDITNIVPTEKQCERISEILSAVRSDIQIIDKNGEHIYHKSFDSDKLLDTLKSVNGIDVEA